MQTKSAHFCPKLHDIKSLLFQQYYTIMLQEQNFKFLVVLDNNGTFCSHLLSSEKNYLAYINNENTQRFHQSKFQ